MGFIRDGFVSSLTPVCVVKPVARRHVVPPVFQNLPLVDCLALKGVSDLAAACVVKPVAPQYVLPSAFQIGPIETLAAKRPKFVRDSFSLGDTLHDKVHDELVVARAPSCLAQPQPSARASLAASCGNAAELADLLARDSSPFALCPRDPVALLHHCEVAYAHADKAYALRTCEKDMSDWKVWVAYCSSMGTTPWRTDPEATPHGCRVSYLREVVLLTNALAYFMRNKRPRSNSDSMIRPATALATLRSVQRVHKRNHHSLIPLSALNLSVKGLMRSFVEKFGPTSLIVKRREPFSNPMILTMLRVQSGSKMGRRVLQWDSLFGRSFAAALELASETGFRKVELFKSNDESDFMHWCNLCVMLDNVLYAVTSLTLEMWMSFSESSLLVITPPLSKADQFGIVWGPLPVYRKYNAFGRSAVRQIQLLAIHRLQSGAALEGPVFLDDDGSALSCDTMRTALFRLLCLFLPDEIAKLYTWHSFRISLACALLAAGSTNAQIQAVLRWQTEESLRVYARMGVDQQLGLIAAAQLATITAVQSRNTPVYEAFDMFLALRSISEAPSE